MRMGFGFTQHREIAPVRPLEPPAPDKVSGKPRAPDGGDAEDEEAALFRSPLGQEIGNGGDDDEAEAPKGIDKADILDRHTDQPEQNENSENDRRIGREQ